MPGRHTQILAVALISFVMLMLSACDSPSAPTARAAEQFSIAALRDSLPSDEHLNRPERQPASLLGANLTPITDYSRTPVYVDLMHQARRFGTVSTPWDEKALLGEDGWPIGDFGTFLMTGQAGASGISGTYKVSFHGQAKVNPVASRATIKNVHYDPKTQRSTLDLELPEDAEQLTLAFTQTGSGIRDLKIIRPGYDAINPPLFTRPFIEHIARFKTLRFMDWLRTNNNTVTSWSNRSTPEKTHYASKNGVPWEHVIALANQTKQDIWINIPVNADDDYVRQLAKLLKESLNAESRIYVEYSNEVWNGQFKQHAINFDLAEAEVRDNPRSPLAFDGKRERSVLGYRRIAKRGKEISDLFRNAYGDAAMMTKIRPVFASQVVNPYATQLGLNFISNVYGPPAQYFYALAVAPYFNLGEQQRAEGLSTDDVLQAMKRSIERLPEINHLERNVALARWYGLPFIAYEGGSDTFGPGSLEAKRDASLDPRMEEVCRDYLRVWYENGGGLFMWFNAGAGNWNTPYGTWELTTDLAISNTAKTRCIDATLATARPALKGRNIIPGRIDALAYVGNRPPYSDASRKTIRYLHPGNFVDYLILAPNKGGYQLVIKAEAEHPGNSIDISINGRPVGPGVPINPGGWGKPIDQPAVSLMLESGFNTLRITTRSETSGYGLESLNINPSP